MTDVSSLESLHKHNEICWRLGSHKRWNSSMSAHLITHPNDYFIQRLVFQAAAPSAWSIMSVWGLGTLWGVRNRGVQLLLVFWFPQDFMMKHFDEPAVKRIVRQASPHPSLKISLCRWPHLTNRVSSCLAFHPPILRILTHFEVHCRHLFISCWTICHINNKFKTRIYLLTFEVEFTYYTHVWRVQ